MATIGVDWGSSTFRAYCYDKNGAVATQIQNDSGILKVKNGDFAKTLFKQLDSFLGPKDDILLSGMITSRNGWIETPYAELPLGINSYLTLALTHKYNGVNLVFLPGVCQRQPPDVMRGEELQIFGACAAGHDALVVLPGTHSKWVDVRNGDIVAFQTTMTGEIYDLLMNNSLIGAVADGADFVTEAFVEGVKKGADSSREAGTVLAKIFSARSAVLLEQLTSGDVASFLSGLLIGSEIAAGIACRGHDFPHQILIIGNQMLSERYLSAFKILVKTDCIFFPDAAERGYSRIVSQFGILSP